MSDCCLTPNQEFSSHVMASTSYRGTFNDMMMMMMMMMMMIRSALY